MKIITTLEEWKTAKEQERNWACIYGKLSPGLISYAWQEMTESQRRATCQNQILGPIFIFRHWKEMTEEQRSLVYYYQKLDPSFISSHWENMTGYQRRRVCIHQTLDPTFILKNWQGMTEEQRFLVCEYQKLDPTFILDAWPEMTEEERDTICEYQPLTPELVAEIRPTLTVRQFVLLLYIHQSFPGRKERIRRAKKYAARYNLPIKDEYLYAFRNHGPRGEGQLKPTTRYLPGKTYRDWHCDPRNIGDSFGFSIIPKGNTPIRVALEDFVTAPWKAPDGQARVLAFTVLEKKSVQHRVFNTECCTFFVYTP